MGHDRFCYFLGFIDFIVHPTMNVLGDALDIVLKPFDYGGRPVPIENAESATNERSLYRPWTNILAVNKSKWTAKHDAGQNQIFYTKHNLKNLTLIRTSNILRL